MCSPLSKSFFHAEHSSEGGKDAAVHVVAIAAGAKHSAALDIKGKLYMWGYNEKSQCGNGASKNPDWIVLICRGAEPCCFADDRWPLCAHTDSVFLHRPQ